MSLFLYSGEAIPLDQELTITKAVCPSFEKWYENYDECYRVDFLGYSTNRIILLKEKRDSNLLLGYFEDQPDSAVVAFRESHLDKVTKVNFKPRLLS